MSFFEFLLIVVLALLVLGPQRLAELAVKLGKISHRARVIYAGIKRDIEREMEEGRREPADSPPDVRPVGDAHPTHPTNSRG